MKKVFKGCLYVALFLLVCLLSYLTITNKIEWGKWLDYVFYGAGAVGALMLVISPSLDKISKAKTAIDLATKNTTNQNNNNAQIVKDLETMKSDFKKEREDYVSQIKKRDADIDNLKSQVVELKEICKIGFMNQNELVSKGVAKKIAEVGVKDECEHKD